MKGQLKEDKLQITNFRQNQVQKGCNAIEGIEQSLIHDGFLSERIKGGGLNTNNIELSPKPQKLEVKYQKKDTVQSKKLKCDQLVLVSQSKQKDNEKCVKHNSFFNFNKIQKKGRIISILEKSKVNKMFQKQLAKYEKGNQIKQQKLIKLNEMKNEEGQLSLNDGERKKLTLEYERKKMKIVNRQSIEEKKQKLEFDFKNHTSKGKNFKFSYDGEGEMLFFQQKQHINKRQSANYRIISQQDMISKTLQKDKRQTYYTPKSTKSLNHKFNKYNSLNNLNQKGSLNVNNINNYTQRYVKNDLLQSRRKIFSNNQMRQTTNLSFFKVKQGAQYTELTNNFQSELKIKGDQAKSLNQNIFQAKKSGYTLYSSLLMNNSNCFSKADSNNCDPNVKDGSINKKQLNKKQLNPQIKRIKSQLTFRTKKNRDRISIKNGEIVKEMMSS